MSGIPYNVNMWSRLPSSGTTPAQGCVCFSDYFNYGATTIIGNAAYTIGYWNFPSNFIKYEASGPLTFDNPGYSHDFGEFSVGKLTRNATSTPRFCGVLLNNPIVNFLPTTNGIGEFWFSALIATTGTVSNGNFFGIELSGYTNSSSFGINPVHLFGIRGNGTTPTLAARTPDGSFIDSTVTLTINQPLLVVVKAVFDNTPTCELSIWGFNVADSIPNTVSGLGTPDIYVEEAENGQAFNIIRVGQISSLPFSIDSIRVSENAGDLGLQAVLTPVNFYSAFPGRLAIWQYPVIKNIGASHQEPQIDVEWLIQRYGLSAIVIPTRSTASPGIIQSFSGDPVLRMSTWSPTYVPGDIGESTDTTRHYYFSLRATVGTMNIDKISFHIGNATVDRSCKVRIRHKADSNSWVESGEYIVTNHATEELEWGDLGIEDAVEVKWQIYIFETRDEFGDVRTDVTIITDDVSIWGTSNVV